MPSHYYSRSWPLGQGSGSGGPSLQVVVLDTVPLDEHNFHRNLIEDMGPQHARRLLQEQEVSASGRMDHPHLRRDGQGNGTTDKAAMQLSWLASTLKASTASVVLVAGHYPIYSAGHHGDSAVMQRDVQPLLKQYNVSAYLAGTCTHYPSPLFSPPIGL